MPILIARGSSAFRPRTDRSMQIVSAQNADGHMRILSFADYALNIQRANLIGAWFPGESAGASCFDNSDQRNNATACSLSIPEPCISGITGASFNGASAHVNVYSTAFNSDFNGNELTMFVMARTGSAGSWTDGATRNLFHFAVSASNDVFITKTSTDYTIRVSYAASGTTKIVNNLLLSNQLPRNCYFTMALTVSATASQFMGFFNGEQFGTTQTGLLNWSGALAVAQCTIGANSIIGANPWVGWIGAALVWSKALDANTIRNLHRYSGAGA